jgi:tetratricopeptide (TPR) repeat protein
MELYKESIQIDPYLTPAYLDLAEIYLRLKDRKNSLQILDDVLKMDPGNDTARQERLKVEALPN